MRELWNRIWTSLAWFLGVLITILLVFFALWYMFDRQSFVITVQGWLDSIQVLLFHFVFNAFLLFCGCYLLIAVWRAFFPKSKKSH